MNALKQEILNVLAVAPATYLRLESVSGCTDYTLRRLLAEMLVAGEVCLGQQSILDGRFGFALVDKQDRGARSFAALQGLMLEELDVRGPMSREDLRERLCCASLQKFEAVVAGLLQAKQLERHHGALRLVGDTRALPEPGSLNVKYQRRLARQKAQAVAYERELPSDFGFRLVAEALGAAH